MRSCFILFFMCCLLINAGAQEISLSLYKSSCIIFRNSIYVAGYEDAIDGLAFKIIRYNQNLEKIGENMRPLGKHKYGDLYPPALDTTHGFLNVVVQEVSNEKTALFLRYTSVLKKLTQVEKAEITRINSFAAFDEDKLYYKNQLYVVREAKDSAGRFYLYRYDLKDSTGLFNYDLKWQFNFDQHAYHRIHPLFASGKKLFLYVICVDGPKKGQWILALDPKSGELSKAIKLNRNENEFCFVSKLELYGGSEDVAIVGVKYDASLLDLKSGKVTTSYQGVKSLNLFFCHVDSAGAVKQRLENFPAVPNDLLKEKEWKEFILRCNNLTYAEDGLDAQYECLYKGKDGIFRTYGMLLVRLSFISLNAWSIVNTEFVANCRNEKKYPNCRQVANQYDNDKPADADRLFYKNAFMKDFSEARSSLQKKEAAFISAYDNKKTGTLELYKYVMKNFVWETTAIKNVTDYSRHALFHLANSFINFYTTKDEKGFVLVRSEL